MKIKTIFVYVLLLSLTIIFASAAFSSSMGFENVNIPKIYSPITPTTDGGNSSINSTYLDANYKRLDNGNSPSANWDINNFDLYNVHGLNLSYLDFGGGASQIKYLGFPITKLAFYSDILFWNNLVVVGNASVLGISFQVNGKEVCLNDSTNCPQPNVTSNLDMHSNSIINLGNLFSSSDDVYDLGEISRRFSNLFLVNLWATNINSTNISAVNFIGDGSALSNTGGYVMQTTSGRIVSPLDNTTYYFGNTVAPVTGETSAMQMPIPRNGTITNIVIFSEDTVLGSSEKSTLYFRKNQTTNTSLGTFGTDFLGTTQFPTNINVTAGDYFDFRWDTPAWATNPTNSQFQVSLYIT